MITYTIVNRVGLNDRWDIKPVACDIRYDSQMYRSCKPIGYERSRFQDRYNTKRVGLQTYLI